MLRRAPASNAKTIKFPDEMDRTGNGAPADRPNEGFWNKFLTIIVGFG
jgi:hypothetical protein